MNERLDEICERGHITFVLLSHEVTG
jgi:hypothetical protein